MFDYATGTATPHRTGYSRLVTGVASAIVHVAALAAVAIPALYATDVLPEPPDMMAFVVNVAPPPPLPPPPPAAEPLKTSVVKPRPAVRRAPSPEPTRRLAVAAPVEAPDEIREEIGYEGLGTTDDFAGVEGGVQGGLPGGVIGGIGTVALPPPPPRHRRRRCASGGISRRHDCCVGLNPSIRYWRSARTFRESCCSRPRLTSVAVSQK